MAEYLAPGVYIEETSFRSRTIEGVGTSTAGFVGPTRFGPIQGEPEVLTSFPEFERVYGGLDRLTYDGARTPNYLAHAVRAFFDNGGSRLYVSRVFEGAAGDANGRPEGAPSGHAWAEIDDEPTLMARYPGDAGNVQVAFTATVGPNVLVGEGQAAKLAPMVVEFDTVLVVDTNDGAGSRYYDVERGADGQPLQLRRGEEDPRNLADAQSVHVLTIDVAILKPIDRPLRPGSQLNSPVSYDGLAPSRRHPSALMTLFAKEPRSRRVELEVPFFIEVGEDATGATLAESLLGEAVRRALIKSVQPPANADDDDEPAEGAPDRRRATHRLTGGNDGAIPSANQYRGQEAEGTREKSGLLAFEDIEDISIVAAPGYSFRRNDDGPRFQTIQGLLITHCQRMSYRVAVLDARDALSIGEVRDQRGQINSKHAALYYPWVRVLDPITGREINLPPSGFVAGIYARNDIERGVHKAPANEVVNLAIGFETFLNKRQQDVLNPEGVNCFRFFEGRGYRLWGARTISSDPEWKYINVRRYFAYLERSIDRGTQWVVFEPNASDLWAKVRRTIEDFLYNEWANRRLMGTKPEQGYFVRCDRSTMTQNDIDNGRLICLIGVAPIRPAEFVIFRIGQWTGDARR